MVVRLSIPLFGKPSWEMNIEGGNATPKMLREKAAELKERLERAADALEKLDMNGWDLEEAYGSIYSLDLYKDVTIDEAKKELKQLGLEYLIENLEEEELEEDEV